MRKHIAVWALIVAAMSAIAFGQEQPAEGLEAEIEIEAEEAVEVCDTDTILPRSMYLTNEDLDEVAAALGVDVPAIHAVIDIEAGPNHVGFWTEGKPVINFSLTQFRRQAKQRGINLDKYAKSHAVIFAAPNVAKYGSQQAAQQARVDAAMSIDSVATIQSTFWGMFQIGGFNWKRCGCQSPQQFYGEMCDSERGQLDLFADFLVNTGLDTPLRKHDWNAFARGYNGASYARRGYHTKLSRAYKKYSQELP